jgi:hypothetical protein
MPSPSKWSRAIHDHPSARHGIAYRSNHDNGELCIALFEQAADRLRVKAQRSMLADRHLLAGLLKRYEVGLG